MIGIIYHPFYSIVRFFIRALGRNHIASTPFSGHRNAMF
jgi:hypothetical protein